jgi:hypothetical protein
MKTLDPFALLSASTQRVLGWLALLATVALTATLGVLDAPLRTHAAPNGIVSFELAGSMSASQAILASWDASARVYAGLSLGLDFAYPVAYSTLLALGCAWASRSGPNAWRALGVWLCWGQWLAALFDCCENIGLIALLLGARSSAWPMISASCATLKFAFVTGGVLNIVAGVVVRSLAHWKQSGRRSAARS